jgi:putative alpha-1,2-mannosidase
VPGRAELLLGSPVFTRVVINRSNGVRMTVNADTTDTYISSVRFRGQPLTRSWLPESFIQKGGTVSFTQSPTPDTTWATSVADLPKDH